MSGSFPIRVRSRARNAFASAFEGGQQHAGSGVAARQRHGAVQRHDGLAGAGAAADPRGSVVVALNEPPLHRVQEHRPFVPRVIERPLQFLDIGQHTEPPLRVGVGEGIGLDRGALRHRRHGTGCQVQERLGRLLRQVIGDLEQRILGGAPHGVEPIAGYAIAEQRVVRDPGEQQRLLRWLADRDKRCFGYRRPSRRFHALRQLDELCRAGRRVALDPAALGPGVSIIVVADITKQQAHRRPMHNQANLVTDPHRPEIRVARPFESMKPQARASQVQLQIESCRLDRLLLGSIEPGEAGGKRVGDAKFHLAASPKLER
jgi:hypothetical protein